MKQFLVWCVAFLGLYGVLSSTYHLHLTRHPRRVLVARVSNKQDTSAPAVPRESRRRAAASGENAHFTHFDAAGQDLPPNDAPHSIATREALRQYDPELFALIAQTMAYDGHVDWRLRSAR